MRTYTLRIVVVLSTLLLTSHMHAADEPATKPTKPLTITVVDAETQKPLAGATVSLRGRKGYSEKSPVDADGKCTVQYDPEHSYQSVMARMDGYVPTAAYWNTNGQGPVTVPETFTIALPKGKRVGGRVVDEAGKPVEGVTVVLEHWPHNTEPSAVVPRISGEKIKTDAEGKWSWVGVPADTKSLGVRFQHKDFVKDDESKAPPIAELLAGTAVTTLDPGIDITGRVVDADGKPVKDAKVTTVQTSYVSNDYGIKTTTDADGKFRLAHLRKDKPIAVTVTAKGFGPELKMVSSDAAAGPTPLTVTLKPGKTLKGRVVDDQGTPLAKASLNLRGWRGMASISWSGETDADGRFTMSDAPSDAMEFQVSREGFRYIVDQKLTASDEEVVVTMLPEMRACGTVVDAETNKPIGKFRVLTGAQLWEHRPPSFAFDRPREGTDGKFDVKIDAHNQVVASYVRVEADGYAPAVTPAIRGKGGTYDLRLKRGADVAGVVTVPDGAPAANVEVRLILDGAQVDIQDNEPYRSEGPITKTGADGRFRFPPQLGRIHLLAISDASGCALVTTTADAARDVAIKLQPWSRVAGVYAPGGKPLASGSLTFHLGPIKDPRDPGPIYNWGYSTSTDASGRYELARVPSFDSQPAMLMIGQLEVRGRDERRWLPVRLQPGEALEVNVTGGRTITGRAVAATPDDAVSAPRGMILLTRSIPMLTAMQYPTELLEAAKLAEPVYRSDVAADGSFTIPSLPPGRYEYGVTMWGGSSDSSAAASGALVIPDGPGNQSIDVGEIRYVRGGGVKVGQKAPDVVGRTLDDKPLKLSDFAGRTVVLCVWDSCTGRSDEHLPHLNQLAAAVGADPKVALVGVSMDAISCGMTGIPRRPSTLEHSAWLRGYLPMEQQDLLTKIGGEKWPAILIIGPDRRVLARDLQGEDVAAKLRSLLAQPN